MSLESAFACQLGSTVLAGLTTLDAGTNPEVQSDVGIGSQFPQFAAIVGVKPRIQFKSRAIAAILAVTGTTGSAAFSDVLKFVAWWAELTDGVIGTDGTSYTLDRGVLVPRSLQCSHRQDATIDCEAISYSSDGSTDPLTIATGTLPTIVQDNVRHTLKSASVAGIDLECITDVSIDFGIGVDSLGCNSDIFDKHIQKDQGVKAIINITTLAGGKLGSSGIPLKGKGAAHADTEIVLRQRESDGIGFDDGTGDITITAAGLATVQNRSGQGPANATTTVQLTCVWDGTNAPLLVS